MALYFLNLDIYRIGFNTRYETINLIILSVLIQLIRISLTADFIVLDNREFYE